MHYFERLRVQHRLYRNRQFYDLCERAIPVNSILFVSTYIVYTLWGKKLHHFIFAITLSNFYLLK